MDIIEQEDRLEAAGFKREQVRELIRLVTSGDAQAMTRSDGERLEKAIRSDGERLEQSLRSEIKRLEEKIDIKIEAAKAQLTSTVWSAVGISAAAVVGLTKLIDLLS